MATKKQPKAKTVDGYVKSYDPDVQAMLNKIRRIIKKAAPAAEEMISYGLVAYKLNKRPLVYFGAWAEHIGFYATPAGNVAFQKELKPYKQAKGSVQFPYDDVPFGLIEKIARFRKQEILKGGK